MKHSVQVIKLIVGEIVSPATAVYFGTLSTRVPGVMPELIAAALGSLMYDKSKVSPVVSGGTDHWIDGIGGTDAFGILEDVSRRVARVHAALEQIKKIEASTVDSQLSMKWHATALTRPFAATAMS